MKKRNNKHGDIFLDNGKKHTFKWHEHVFALHLLLLENDLRGFV